MNFLFIILVSFVFILKNDQQKHVSNNKIVILTCYGNSPCYACKSCDFCKLCTSGGSCSICSNSSNSKQANLKIKTASSIYSPEKINFNQCKALTKNKTRCKRKATLNGYCYQH